ncbi:hypothetical protein [Candidatus Palauibacter sp.]|uniref:hypothetical protein n=1 Tax=Candidatus Palauibacter sp. TaxID=3101350 RepID=UPI003B51F706
MFGLNNTGKRYYAVAYYRALIRFSEASGRSLPHWPARHGAKPDTGITADGLREARYSHGQKGGWHGWDPIIAAVQCLDDAEGTTVTPPPPPTVPQTTQEVWLVLHSFDDYDGARATYGSGPDRLTVEEGSHVIGRWRAHRTGTDEVCVTAPDWLKLRGLDNGCIPESAWVTDNTSSYADLWNTVASRDDNIVDPDKVYEIVLDGTARDGTHKEARVVVTEDDIGRISLHSVNGSSCGSTTCVQYFNFRQVTAGYTATFTLSGGNGHFADGQRSVARSVSGTAYETVGMVGIDCGTAGSMRLHVSADHPRVIPWNALTVCRS